MNDTQNVRFVYATAANGRMTTLAYHYDDSNKQIVVAASQCSAADRFTKRIGREVAFNRLLNGRSKSVSYDALGGTRYALVAGYLSTHVDDMLTNKPYGRKGT